MYPESAEKWVEQGVSSFFAKLLPYLMIFQSGTHRRHCGIFQNHPFRATNFNITLVQENFKLGETARRKLKAGLSAENQKIS